MERDTASFTAYVRPGSRFSPQTRERAVRLLEEHVAEFRNERAALKEIAAKFGMHKETLRRWVLEARAEAGLIEPRLDGKDLRIKELEREIEELNQTVEVLKAATSFFARACDPRPGSSVSS